MAKRRILIDTDVLMPLGERTFTAGRHALIGSWVERPDLGLILTIGTLPVMDLDEQWRHEATRPTREDN